MVSSGVWAGEINLDRAHNLREVGGGFRTMKQELERIGYLGETAASYEAMPIGQVQAYRWHSITVKGRDCHTGTTDFANRADAMLAAATMICHSRDIASKHSALASTGILTLKPGSVNTVPGTVQFSLDIRASEDDRLMEMERELVAVFDRIAKGASRDKDTVGLSCQVEWQLDAPSKAVKFHPDCISMTSGAGHDSVFTGKQVPTSMIFVPCKDGISHNPAEYCAPGDCANGAQILMGAVLRYDDLRAQRAGL
ncbi:MAG: hypothetical protein Q9187_000048 [Circinaria calcarea]